MVAHTEFLKENFGSQVGMSTLSNNSTGNPLMRGTPPQEGGSPSKGGLSSSWGGPGAPSRGFFSLCITIYRRKNQNCKKRQCLWRFMCPLSMHQFIEISICALGKKNQTLWCRATRESLCTNGSVPCTATETIGWTKLPSSVWEEEKIQGLSLWNTNHARREPTFKSMFQWRKKLQTYNVPWSLICDYSKIDIRFSEEI